MVDNIPPIRGTEEILLSQASFFNPIISSTVQPFTGVAGTTQSTSTEQQIDQVLLQQNDDYYLQTMEYLLQNARAYFQNMQYVEAEYYYRQYFQYFDFYRPTFTQTLEEYSPALLEFAWLTEIRTDQRESQKFINQNLLKMLEVVQQ